MRKKLTAMLATLAVTAGMAVSGAVVHAENPIVQTSFTPDPAPVVFGDELYVFTGCDRMGDNDFYKMTGWQCFSTKDMKNWTDHGRILEDTSFSWCGENDAWASQCIERDGKYYFYFTTTNKSGGGRAIGVAVADSPEGPYEDVLGKPLCGPNWNYIDPTVMIDDDGQAWLMFGNPTCYYVKLKEDMVTLDGPIQEFKMTAEAFGPSSKTSGYGEGPWICKRDDLYYLVYAAFIGNDGGESMAYATAPTVTGPWTYRDQIQKGSNCFTIHGGIIDYKEHSYYFYHMNGIPGGGVFNRSAACEEFTFNPDGTIPLVESTKSGPDQLEALNPFIRQEAETMSWSEGVLSEKCSSGGVNVCNLEKGDYIKVSGVNFAEGADSITVSASSASSGGTLELHLDSKTGPVVGTVKIGGTGGWQNWEEFTGNISGASGEHDLYLVMNGGSGYLFNLDWWKFEGDGAASQPEPAQTSTEPKDESILFHHTFERSTERWTGRGAGKVASSANAAFEGSKSLYVTDREAAWNGGLFNLPSKVKAGTAYSFSANVMYDTGSASDTFRLMLEYQDADKEWHYDPIAEGEINKGEWTQLANTSYTIPKDAATDLHLYVETLDSTISFYVDDVVCGADGKVIEGAGQARSVVRGDVNGDGVIDVFDLGLAKRGVLKGFASKADEKAADVNQDGTADLVDLVSITKFLHGRIAKFEVAEQPTTEPTTEPPTDAPKQAMSMKEFTAQCQAKMAMNETEDSKQEKAGVQYGTIKSGTYFSTTCNRNKPYNILLPAGYDSSKKYPVLYCMHGYWENQDRMIIKGNGTMYTRQIIGNAIASGEAKDMIVVFPYIYSSATQENCSGMDDNNNKAYDNFINDLTKDLMPHIEKTYSVKTGKDNTAITGFSMGGRESLAIGMTLTDKFGYIGAICPAPGVNDAYKGGWKFESGKEPYLIMITAGGNDQTVYDTPKPYHENLEKNGVPHIWHYYPAGYHGDNSIHAHLYNFCRFVFQATD